MMSVIVELIAPAKGCKKGRAKGRIGTIESERDGGIREATLLISENWSGAVAVLGTEESRRSCIP